MFYWYLCFDKIIKRMILCHIYHHQDNRPGYILIVINELEICSSYYFIFKRNTKTDMDEDVNSVLHNCDVVLNRFNYLEINKIHDRERSVLIKCKPSYFYYLQPSVN